MRFTRLAAAFCGVAMVTGSAHAALSFSTERTSVDSNFDRVVLYALSDTSTGQAANVIAQKTTTSTTTPNGLKFLVDARSGPIVQSSTPDFPVTTTTSTVVDDRLSPLIGFEDPDHTQSTNKSLFQAGLSSWTIHSAGNNNGVGYLADSSVNGGKGYAVIGAVVPKGADVRFVGSVSDATPDTTSNYVIIPFAGADPANGILNSVPEPTSLGFIGLGALGLIGRRNRRTA